MHHIRRVMAQLPNESELARNISEPCFDRREPRLRRIHPADLQVWMLVGDRLLWRQDLQPGHLASRRLEQSRLFGGAFPPGSALRTASSADQKDSHALLV